MDDPKAEDFFGKAGRIEKEYGGPEPDWIRVLFKDKLPGYLVEPGVLDGILAHLKTTWPNAVAIDLQYKGEDDFLKLLARQLGFKFAPDLRTFLSWMGRDVPCLISIRAEKLHARDFLNCLFWLLDLKEAGIGAGLKVLIERSRRQVEKDAETLWDRLPEDPGEIINSPDRSPKSLSDFVWKTHEKKSVKKLFKKFF